MKDYIEGCIRIFYAFNISSKNKRRNHKKAVDVS